MLAVWGPWIRRACPFVVLEGQPGVGRPRASVSRCLIPVLMRRCWTREGFLFLRSRLRDSRSRSLVFRRARERVGEPPRSMLLTLPIPFGCEAGSVDLPGTETHRVGWSSACGDVNVRLTRSKETCACASEGWCPGLRCVSFKFLKGLFLHVGLFLAKSGERYPGMAKSPRRPRR